MRAEAAICISAPVKGERCNDRERDRRMHEEEARWEGGVRMEGNIAKEAGGGAMDMPDDVEENQTEKNTHTRSQQ
eukprot:2931030-Pyramimonas_sp.AAC.1